MTGAQGEEHAVDFLKRMGYCVIERNFRTVYGEIDIIARDGETWVFIEVKARSALRHDPTTTFERQTSSVNWKKRLRLSRTALVYLSRKKIASVPCRFDVVAIDAGKTLHVALFRNAFEFVQPEGT